METNRDSFVIFVTNLFQLKEPVRLLKRLNLLLELYPYTTDTIDVSIIARRDKLRNSLLDRGVSLDAISQLEELRLSLNVCGDENSIEEDWERRWIDRERSKRMRDIQEMILKGGNSVGNKLEFLVLLEKTIPKIVAIDFVHKDGLVYRKDHERPIKPAIWERITTNIELINEWIKEQRDRLKLVTSDQQKKEPIPEPSLTNVDLLNSIRSFLDEMETIFRLSEKGIEPIEEIRQRYNSLLGQLKRGGQTLFIKHSKEEYFDLVWKVKQLVEVYREESWGTTQLTDYKPTIQELLNSEAAAEQYLTSIHSLRDEYLNEVYTCLKRYLPDQPKEDQTPKQGELTLKQQVILLDLLGVLKPFRNIDNTKKGELFAVLINRSKKNTTDAISYLNIKGKPDNPLQNTKNILAVINLLERFGFDELVTAAREKYKNSLGEIEKGE